MAVKEQKCKIKDAAKDLGLAANDIVAILKERTGEEKKPAASITMSEMNIVLEHISQANQVNSFEAYFATASEKPEKKPEEKESERKRPAAKQMPCESRFPYFGTTHFQDPEGRDSCPSYNAVLFCTIVNSCEKLLMRKYHSGS